MKIGKLIILTSFFLSFLLPVSFDAKAQFYVKGDDRGSLNWSEIKTKHYELIYPSGMDSIARSYGILMEKAYPLEKATSGFFPTEKQFRKRTPVVLHTHNGESNGSVAWAPMRIDLFTMPEFYNPLPTPWAENLALHESRHASQMQFAYNGVFKLGNILLGQMFTGAMAGVYPGPALLEGDAVATETALSNSGRGRTGDFLDYYMMAFDNGDYRNWYKWRYGSNKYYAPNHYALGYLTVAGMRYFYDEPKFMEKYFKSTISAPLRLRHMQRTMSKISGKSFNETFSDIMEGFHKIWTEDAKKRGPFMNSVLFSAHPVIHTEYSRGTFVETPNDETYIYTLKNSMVSSASLVRIDHDGNEKRICRFSMNPSKLSYSNTENRIYWSESQPDIRWELDRSSQIKYLDLNRNKIHTLTKDVKNIRYFNPCPSPSGKIISVTNYPIQGGSSIVFLNADNGSKIAEYYAPDSLQIVESAWIGSKLYCSGLSHNGFALYKFEENESKFTRLTDCKPIKINTLRGIEDKLQFISDRTGVNELYIFNPKDSTISQITNSRYGVKNCLFSPDRDSLYYTMLCKDGYLFYRTSIKDLHPKEVKISDIHSYKVADKLSQQEISLIDEVILDEVNNKLENKKKEKYNLNKIEQAPKKYYKIPNWIRFHSWAPIYFDIDRIKGESLDFDNAEKTSLGVTALFQNTLGTMSGFIGYSAHQDPYAFSHNAWKHSAHLNVRYTGLFPVIEANIDYNDRNAFYYRKFKKHSIHNLTYNEQRLSLNKNNPMLSGNFTTYIPFNFSSNGRIKGLIPRLEYRLTNDKFDKSKISIKELQTNPYDIRQSLLGVEKGKTVLLQSLTTSVRAYSIMPKAEARIFPEYGIGAEVGWKGWLGLSNNITPNLYTYVYGYLPGFMPKHGFKLEAFVQQQFHKKNTLRYNFKNALPRGLSNNYALKHYIQNKYAFQSRISIDYAMPIWLGDFSILSPIGYIKNLELTPNYDCTFLHGGSLMSVGANIGIHFGHIAWFPYDCTLGINCLYNFGSLYGTLHNDLGSRINNSANTVANPLNMKRTRINATFRISL